MLTQISVLILWIVVLVLWWKNREETQRLADKVAELSEELVQIRKQRETL
jgi:hypothetical protein